MKEGVPELRQGPKAKPPRLTYSIFRSDCHLSAMDSADRRLRPVTALFLSGHPVGSGLGTGGVFKCIAQSNTQGMAATQAILSREECQGCSVTRPSEPPRPTDTLLPERCSPPSRGFNSQAAAAPGVLPAHINLPLRWSPPSDGRGQPSSHGCCPWAPLPPTPLRSSPH